MLKIVTDNYATGLVMVIDRGWSYFASDKDM